MTASYLLPFVSIGKSKELKPVCNVELDIHLKSCLFGDGITEVYLLYSKVTLREIILKFLL